MAEVVKEGGGMQLKVGDRVRIKAMKSDVGGAWKEGGCSLSHCDCPRFR